MSNCRDVRRSTDRPLDPPERTGGLAHLSSVRRDNLYLPGGTPSPHSLDAAPKPIWGAPAGVTAIHEERSEEITEARAHGQDTVECPECGASTTPLNIVTWGHCRACHTAQSREMYPLRW